MTFLTPALAVAGLLAVAIPIIIHLLARQRRKPIEWAAMRFLIEAFRKHKRRLQVEQLLLLAARCLIVALLGAALARPILEATGIIASGGSRNVYLVIDDGMVSGLKTEDGRTALDRHVDQAASIVQTLGPGDAVGLITAARPARAPLSPPTSDHGAVINLLRSLKPQQSPTDLPGAIEYVRSAMEQARQNQQQTLVYMFSEFRGGSASLEAPLPTTAADGNDTIRLLATPPATSAVSNVQIVSIDPVRSVILAGGGADDGSDQISVRLARTGGELPADVSRVRLTGEGLSAVEAKIVRWQPGQSLADVKFSLPPNSMASSMSGSSSQNQRAVGLSAIIESDALEADNQRHAVVELRQQIRVLLVDRRRFGYERTLDQLNAGQWIRRALEAGATERTPIQIVEAEPAALDVADVRTADVAIVPRPDLLNESGWRVLKQFVQRDGLLIITPPSEVTVHQWSERMVKDLGLSWRTALEAATSPEGFTLAEQQPSTELLRLISSDLPELSRPVLIERLLRMERDGGASAGSGPNPLIMLSDNTPFAVAGGIDNEAPSSGGDDAALLAPTSSGGLVVYLAAAPELSWTNLPSKPLMVPLFQELVRQGMSVIRAAQQVEVGQKPSLASAPAARELIGPEDRRITLDQHARALNPLENAGIYSVVDQSNQPIGRLAVNVDADAGATDVQSAAAVSSWLKTSGPWTTFDAENAAATLATDRATSPVAGALLLAVLALLILETILARRFSHAYVDSDEATKQRSDEGLLTRPLAAASLRRSAEVGGQS